jgi:ubiquinone/menaquinone biosynthesis C-methylase UbiE
VIGVDNSQNLIEEAQQRMGNAIPQLQFRVEDAQHLRFADNTFDGCRADRLFMHLPHRETVLREMIRVTRPGGWIVVTDPDWDTLIIDAPDRQLTRKILHASADTTANPWSGRELYRLFHESGLGVVAVADTITLVLNDWATANQLYELDDTVAAVERSGSISATDAQMWINSLQQADHDGRFFCAVTAFTVVGQKLQ